MGTPDDDEHHGPEHHHGGIGKGHPQTKWGVSTERVITVGASQKKLLCSFLYKNGP